MSIMRKTFCVASNTLIVVAIAVFAVGFFPHKAFLPGLASWPADSNLSTASVPFDRVIFMVVDALRSDFVYGNASSFRFTQSLIRSGAAVPFTGHASPPTITMPRVKAITTGSVPSFLDLVLNFAESDTSATLALQDTWLAQMKAKSGSKLVMYGDDTWLRLFPGFFERADGTTSFFVSDFTEVDNNVTRHIPDELKQDDWSVMVLHFLGLDHIGHKTGPRGPNMPAKQAEMDDIVKKIYEAMVSEPHLRSSLLVLLGDHGMNEAGNHGASSSGEVSTALTFISPRFKTVFAGLPCPLNEVSDFKYYETVEQSDIAPTLAALLGFPIPRNNLGILVSRLLQLWTESSDQLQLIFQNAQQIHGVASATFPAVFQQLQTESACQVAASNDAKELACSWVRAMAAFEGVRSGSSTPLDAMEAIQMFLQRAQDDLSGTASNYDLQKMHLGITLASFATISAALASVPLFTTFGLGQGSFLLTIGMYAVTMFASSYVEEEHQFWYWALSGWLVVLHCKTAQQSESKFRFLLAALVASLFGIFRHCNQTGQKFAGDPDFVTQVLTEQRWLLWLLVSATYANNSRMLSQSTARWGPVWGMVPLPYLATLVAFLFKVTFTAADAPELLSSIAVLQPILKIASRTSLITLARVVFLGIAQLLMLAVAFEAPWKGKSNRKSFQKILHELLSLLLITQTRTVNIPMFLIFEIQSSLLGWLPQLSTVELTVTSLLLQYSSFFALGGTNAISSVDLSNAYNGVGGYSVLAVGILTFVSNWAGPIWWSSATVRHIVTTRMVNCFDFFSLLSLFTTSSTLAVMVACTVLREHLFIWTVFSPKYLYAIAWVFGQHLVVNGLFCTVLLGA